MPGKICLRRASDSDYRAFYGQEPPEGWVGFCAECEGKVVACGWALIDAAGKTWVGVDRANKVPALMLHRAVRNFIAAMQQEGIPQLYALCDSRIATASRWLTSLGFAIDETIPAVYMPEVAKALPVWKRVLIGVEL